MIFGSPDPVSVHRMIKRFVKFVFVFPSYRMVALVGKKHRCVVVSMNCEHISLVSAKTQSRILHILLSPRSV